MLPKTFPNPECKFDGCGRKRSSRGYCNGHYEQIRLGRGLSPLGGRALSDDQRFMQRVKKSAECWRWSGAISKKSGYGTFPIGRTSRPAHCFAYEKWVGPIPAGMEVDHRCHNRACVNPAHLRAVTSKQNNENRLGAERTNKAGIRGVSWSKSQMLFRARVTHYGKTIHLGYFGTAEEAGEAARLKRLELFTHNDRDRAAV